jgi:hypothetical protein
MNDATKDAIARGVRSNAPARVIGGAVEATRSNAAGIPQRVAKLNEKMSSKVRDANVIKEFDDRVFKEAIPDIDGAADAVGSFNGVEKTFNRLHGVYNRGYKDVFDNSEVSAETAAAFKKMREQRLDEIYGARKKGKDGKLGKRSKKPQLFYAKEEQEIVDEALRLFEVVGKGVDDDVAGVYKALKNLHRDSGDDRVKSIIDAGLRQIKNDIPAGSLAKLQKLDAKYPVFKAIEDAKSGSKGSDLLSHSDVMGGARMADITAKDNILGGILQDWSPISGVQPRITYNEMAPLNTKYKSELLKREEKFKKAVTGKKRTLDVDRYTDEAGKRKLKELGMGLNDVFD